MDNPEMVRVWNLIFLTERGLTMLLVSFLGHDG